MGAHTFRLVQNAAVVWDFNNGSNDYPSQWQPAPYSEKLKKVEDTLVINPKGSTATAFFDNLVSLGQVTQDGIYNFYQWQNGMPYTPIWLQFKKDGSSTMMQSEFFGGDRDAIDNFISASIRSNILTNFPYKLWRRPYWEELSPQTLANAVSVANGGKTTISGIRGDVPSPLQIKVRTATTNQDRVIIGIKHNGTISNWVSGYEGESATTLGSGVASFSDANLSNGASARWTPAVTTEQSLIIQRISSNISDQMGRYRVLVRARDDAAQANVKIRARGGIWTSGGGYQMGDYGDFAKYVDGTGDGSGGLSYPTGTTAIPLVDCGVITLPPVDTQGVAPSTLAVEIMGTALLTGTSNRFEIDCFYLVPCYELPYGAGYISATMYTDMGNAAAPDAIVDANDRVPYAYLDDTGVLQHPATDIRGKPMCGWNSDSMAVMVLTQKSNNFRHTQNLTNTVTITTIPRYRFPGRGS